MSSSGSSTAVTSYSNHAVTDPCYLKTKIYQPPASNIFPRLQPEPAGIPIPYNHRFNDTCNFTLSGLNRLNTREQIRHSPVHHRSDRVDDFTSGWGWSKLQEHRVNVAEHWIENGPRAPVCGKESETAESERKWQAETRVIRKTVNIVPNRISAGKNIRERNELLWGTVKKLDTPERQKCWMENRLVAAQMDEDKADEIWEQWDSGYHSSDKTEWGSEDEDDVRCEKSEFLRRDSIQIARRRGVGKRW